MALHTKKAFAEMCGLTTGNLSVYEGRHKVVYSGDYVNDDIEPNKGFLEKRKIKAAVKAEVEKPAPIAKKETKPQQKAPSAPKTDGKQRESSDFVVMDAEKMRLQNEKLELANEFLRKKLQKIEGEAIPTELVKGIVSQLGRTYPTEYYTFWEQTMTELARKYRIPIDDVAFYRGYGREGINKFSTRAIDQARRELKQVQTLYSQKRDVGERDV